MKIGSARYLGCQKIHEKLTSLHHQSACQCTKVNLELFSTIPVIAVTQKIPGSHCRHHLQHYGTPPDPVLSLATSELLALLELHFAL